MTLPFRPLRPLSERAAPGRTVFRAGACTVRVDRNRIDGPAGSVPVEPKVMELLAALAERPGDVLHRDELLDRVWQGAYVTDDVLTRAIGLLRRAFREVGEERPAIETVRKRGYALRLPVAPCKADGEADGEGKADGEGEGAEPSGAPEAPPRRRSRLLVAVGVLLLVAVALAMGLLLGGREPSPAAGAGAPRIVPVTTAPGDETEPALSPDGSRVAYLAPGLDGRPDLYVRTVGVDVGSLPTSGAGAPLRLTETPGDERAPAWSPDGTRLAFTRLEGERCRLLLIPALGGPELEVAPCGDPGSPRVSFSPDGRRLARAVAVAGGGRRVELLPLDRPLDPVPGSEAGASRPLTHPPAGIPGDDSPVFSPDGERVAFIRSLGGGLEDLFWVPAAGGEELRLTHDGAGLAGVDWLQRGGGAPSLVFSSERGGTYTLWELERPGTRWARVRLLAGGGGKLKRPSVAGNGRVAYERWLYTIDLRQVATWGAGDGGPVAPATDQWSFDPALSPDGSRVAFISSRGGASQVWVAGTGATGTTGGQGSSGARPLTSFAAAPVETPRWSPDGRSLVYAARPGRDGRSDLFLQRLDALRPLRLTRHPADDLAPVFSADGGSVLFASNRTGRWEIWRVPAAGGEAEPVTAEGGFVVREAPDGAGLYLWRPGAASISFLPAGGGRERPAAPAPSDWRDWTVVPAGLFFVDWHEDTAVLHRVTAPGAEPEPLRPLPGMDWSGFDVSPDGATVIYPRTEQREIDVMLLDPVR